MAERHQPLQRTVRKVCLRLTVWCSLVILIRSEENFWIAVFAAIYLYIADASAWAQKLTDEPKRHRTERHEWNSCCDDASATPLFVIRKRKRVPLMATAHPLGFREMGKDHCRRRKTAAAVKQC